MSRQKNCLVTLRMYNTGYDINHSLTHSNKRTVPLTGMFDSAHAHNCARQRNKSRTHTNIHSDHPPNTHNSHNNSQTS